MTAFGLCPTITHFEEFKIVNLRLYVAVIKQAKLNLNMGFKRSRLLIQIHKYRI